MAVPTTRRVIFSSHISPKKEYATTSTSETREEGSTVGKASYDKYLLNTTVGKVFGGSGIRTITAEQSMDGWVSFEHPYETWDAMSQSTDIWEDNDVIWDGEKTVTSTTVIRSGTDAIKFLYIKNTGTANDVNVTLDGTNAYLIVPPGGAISLRLNSAVANSNEIKVQSTGSTIEYVIAK